MNVDRKITKIEKRYLMFKFSGYFYLHIDGKTVQSEKRCGTDISGRF